MLWWTIQKLKWGNGMTRWLAAEKLGESRDPLAVEGLIEALTDRDKYVRQAVAEALGKIGDARAVTPLIAALQVEFDSTGHKAAAEALGQIGDARAVGPLVAALRSLDCAQVAAEALVKIGAAAVPALFAELQDEHGYARYLAAKALTRIDPNWSKSEAAKQAIPSLLAVLKHKGSHSRRAAVCDALGYIGDARAVEPLLALFKDEKDLRGQAAEALGRIRRTVSALNDKDLTVPSAATEALGRIGEAAVEPLLAALKDKDLGVRKGAAEMLGEIGDPLSVEPLVNAALKDGELDVKSTAKDALRKIGDPHAVELLEAALKDEDWHVRFEAEFTLEMLGKGLTKPKGGVGATVVLDAVLVVFDREFSPKDKFVKSILEKMQVHGRPYKDWISDSTPVKILVSLNAQNPMTIMAHAMVQFRRLVPSFSVDRVEHATFEGAEGISGSIVTHWSG